MAKVKYFSLRYITGKKEEYINADTIDELLDIIHEKYPKMRSYDYHSNGKVAGAGDLTILVNGRNIAFLGGLDTKLEKDNVVALLLPAGGG